MKNTLKRARRSVCVVLAAVMVCCLVLGAVPASAENEEYTVNTANVTVKPMYIVEDSAQTEGGNLLVNGDVKITDFSNAGCGWKDLGWAGFDGNRLKITFAWEANAALDGMPIGFAQDIAVEKNTDYTFKFTAMQWNLSTKPDHSLTIGILDTTKEGIVYKEGTTQTVKVAHGTTQEISLTINSGDAENIRLAVTTTYESPNITGNFGGYFINDLSFSKSVEKLTNADLSITDFGNPDVGWKDLGWAGFDGNRLKLTWAWFADPGLNGIQVAAGQEISVEPNTDYYLQFNVMQFNVSGRANHDLIIGFADPAVTEGDPYLEGQKAVLSNASDDRTYYVAFNSGDHDKVVLRFETAYEAPVNDCTFGGFFISNTSLKKIVGAENPTLDVVPTPAEGYSNYVYIGDEGNTMKINPNITNLVDYGLTMDDVKLTFSSNNSDQIATVSEDGVVTAGTRKGAFNVTVHASIEYNGMTIEGSGVMKLRVIKPTDDVVFIKAEDADLPLVANGENILNNGDFESAAMDTATTDHTQRADVWRSVIGTWMNTEAEAGMNGSYGGKITWRWQSELTEEDSPGFYQDVAVEPFTTYQLNFYVYNWTGVANGHNDLYVGYRNPNADDIWAPVVQYNVATPDIGMQNAGLDARWTKVTTYLYTGELSEIRVFFCCDAQSGHEGGAGWWFDNISLKKVTGVNAGTSVTSMDFNVPVSVRIGDTIETKAYDVYDYGYRVESSFQATVTTSDANIIAVENGKLVAKGVGTATVTFSGKNGDTNIEQSYEITVLPVPESVTVKVGSDNTINEGRDQKIVVTVTYTDGTTETINKNCVFTASNGDIIAQKGNTFYLSGKKAGTATLNVEVTIDGVVLNGSVEVTVKGEATNEPAETKPIENPGTNPGGDTQEPSSGLPTGAIVAICVIALAAVAVVLVVIKRKNK